MVLKINREEVKTKDINQTISSFIKKFKGHAKYQDTIKYVEEKNKQFKRFTAAGKSRNSKINQLIILRKWNSYTPILPTITDPSKKLLIKGGGYFLNYQNYGIVIDPGYNFIENFLNANCKIDDIDAIIITHAHDDHTAQLESLFSLLYKRNKNKRTSFKKIDLYLNLGSFKKFSGYFDLSNPKKNYYVNKILILNKHHLFSLNDDIDVFTTNVKHHEMITNKYAIGLTFILRATDKSNKPTVIKFTSDTGWSSLIEEENRKIAEVNLKREDINNVDILVSHIGSIKLQEMNYNTSKSLFENEKRKNILYKYHLGLIGTVASINFWKPKITLISEFGQELDAIRLFVAELLSDELNTPVLSVDLNFRINLDSYEIRCYKDKKFYNIKEVKCDRKKDSSIVYFNESKFTLIERTELKSTIDEISLW